MRTRTVILAIHQSGELYGSDYVFLEAIKVLSTKYSVHVILGSAGPLAKELEPFAESIKVMKIGVFRKKWASPNGLLLIGFQLISSWIRLLPKAMNAQVIYSSTAVVVLGAMLAATTSKPHVWHVHEILEQSLLERIVAGLIRNFGGRKLFVSEMVRRSISPAAGNVLLNCLRSNLTFEAGLSDKAIVPPLKIAVVGRLSPRKGQLVFLDAIAIARRSYPALQVAIYGDAFEGYEFFEKELRDRINEQDLSTVVTLNPYSEDIDAVFRESHVAVVPSINPEAFGLVTIEAMSRRCAVIATNVGHSAELIRDGETGLLVPPNDPASLSAAILRLAMDSSLLFRLGEQGYTDVSNNYLPERFAGELLQHFSAMTGQAARS